MTTNPTTTAAPPNEAECVTAPPVHTGGVAVAESIAALESYADALESRHAGHLAAMGKALRDERERARVMVLTGPCGPQATRITGGREAHRHGWGDADAALNRATYVHNRADDERQTTDRKTGKRRAKTLADHRADYLDILSGANEAEREVMDPRDTMMLADHHIAAELRHLAETQRAMLAVVESDDWQHDEAARDEARKTLKRAGREAHEMLANLSDGDPLDPTTNAPDDGDARQCAIGYVRVSTVRQGESGLGLEDQRLRIDRACAAHEWNLVHVYEDIQSSAKARPHLEEAMQHAARLGCVLVVADDDRVSRSTIETLTIHDRAQKQGWHLYAANMPTVDTTTDEGRFMATVFAAFAELERAKIRRRTKRAMLAKIARGEPVGRPKLGDGKTDTPEDAERARTTIARLAELRASGLSYERLADAMNAEGIPGLRHGKWHKSSAFLACKRYGIQ